MTTRDGTFVELGRDQHGPLVFGVRCPLTGRDAVLQTVYMSSTTGKTEIWQARIEHQFADDLRADAQILGLDSRTDIVRTALQDLHRRAVEERMASTFDAFYHGEKPPQAIGVIPADAP